MSTQKDRARELMRDARNILLRDWDPIGISDNPHLGDEYDVYVPQIVGKLMGREPRHRLIDHLLAIEVECIGLDGDRSRAGRVADRLIDLHSAHEAGSERGD